jgi:hypothetical protein
MVVLQLDASVAEFATPARCRTTQTASSSRCRRVDHVLCGIQQWKKGAQRVST